MEWECVDLLSSDDNNFTSTENVFDSLPPTATEESKLEIAGALLHCVNLLETQQIITSLDKHNGTITVRSKLMGKIFATKILEIISTHNFVNDEEITFQDMEEVECSNSPDPMEDSPKTDSSGSSSSDNTDCKQDIHVPLSIKAKVVSLARLHPKWSIKSLQANGSKFLKSRQQLSRWKKQIEKGGSTKDKLLEIDRYVYDRFWEARKEKRLIVNTRSLQLWALAAAFQYGPDFHFSASEHWAKNFKIRHKIRQRRITKYVAQKEIDNMNELQQVAELFQDQTRQIIHNFDPDFVINTDQSGVQYEMTTARTLSFQGEKTTEAGVQHLSKTTHSYTIQYALTLSGKLLSKVFICLQESTGAFGPQIKEQVQQMMNEFKNIIITCTKSGKLQSSTYEQYLDTIILPYVGEEPFLYILDSWGGQIKQELYDRKFKDSSNLPTCTLKVIPPKCTPICQPCDVYFYRQVKNYIRKIQNCWTSNNQCRDLSSRSSIIKIQSLVHNQLQAPIYSDMIRYAWYASRLSENRAHFINVNQAAFPVELNKQFCSCKSKAFIRCAWCLKFLCFHCFFENYHPSSCTSYIQSGN